MKKISFILIICLTLSLFFSFSANASIFGNALKNTAANTEFGTTAVTPAEYAASIVSVLLTLIGIVFVVLIIYGGFLYMTAMGESEKVKKGKNVIIASIIGLAIILSGYSITYFITLQLEQPGAGTPGPNPGYEDPGSLDYNSLNACEYRFARYGETSAACCAQSDFCNAHTSQCGGTCQ